LVKRSKTDFKPAIRIHLKLPTHQNDGTPFRSSVYKKQLDEFMKIFGGWTQISPPATGGWLDESKTKFLDVTTTYDIFVDKHRFINKIENGKGLAGYVERLRKRYNQKSISCYYHDIMSTV
jgi:hypothetical protein